ncbi:hypothetical protein C0Z01_21330 [Photobacterium kishitanii]|uniref:Uncharacterized protein n=1 Tax=Photobacterium kishitanii TaxID=318456 RepID=A0A0B7JHF5_9GAMM|nr:hypothetical protein AYY22_05675 [Photobacterium kishitanii]PSU91807.1 hypothetical protein C0W42_03885 [Photobacterium kishitanii]PSU92506.1 hypothetical protein C9J27_22205 [Photobacterium kishitanii]PSU93040.1 hypothetical protein C0W35_13540 [Photobacterium kishitanii]PSV20311.1 hypothetical protein C0W28_09315 [Photobacterium kishitanii]
MLRDVAVIDLLKDILGWTSVVFYILITIFNTMKVTRYAAFASATNDTIWSILMGWWPKVILNLSVTAINLYRYFKDFTQTAKIVIQLLAAVMIIGISYIIYVAIHAFIAEPTLAVGLQFVDLGVIVIALYMTELKKYRILMLLSGFVGMAGYYGNPQMMIIKALVIIIMSYKLFTTRNDTAEQLAAENK